MYLKWSLFCLCLALQVVFPDECCTQGSAAADFWLVLGITLPRSSLRLLCLAVVLFSMSLHRLF